MTRLTSLFESTNAPSQQYQRPTERKAHYENDPSLHRVLTTAKYYDNLPSRVSAIATLLHRTATQARRETQSADLVWDFTVSGLSGLMTQLGQDMAIRASGDPLVRDQSGTAVSGQVVQNMTRRWTDAVKGPEGRAALLQTLRQWQSTVQALADNPASDVLAPAYAKYAEQLGAFCTKLQTVLTQGPDTVLAIPSHSNMLDLDPFEGLLEESGEPATFRNALNHKTPQEALTNSVTWLMQNRSGSVWISTLISLISGIEDFASALRAGKENHPQLAGTSLRAGIAAPMASVLEDVSSDAQTALLTGMTRTLKEVGLWKSAPASARNDSTPRTVQTLVDGYDYRALQSNLIYALTDEGGRAVQRSFLMIAQALEDAGKRAERGALLVELNGEDRAELVDALLRTATRLRKEFGRMKSAFSPARLYENPLI